MQDRLSNSEGEPMREQRVVLIMGSPSDAEHGKKIVDTLSAFGVTVESRVSSAHKTPKDLLDMISEYNSSDVQTVFIAVAGRSNALGGFLDSQTNSPVISSPPYSDKFGGGDIYSSLRMPSGSGAVTAAEPEMAALHAIKILALYNPELATKFTDFQLQFQEKLREADERARSGDLFSSIS